MGGRLTVARIFVAGLLDAHKQIYQTDGPLHPISSGFPSVACFHHFWLPSRAYQGLRHAVPERGTLNFTSCRALPQEC